MRYSVIIPVYNRPEEVDELLDSLVLQDYKNFEVIIVEDGSNNPCKEIVEHYQSNLTLSYFFKKNSGPGTTRNYGAQFSQGEYLIILDSDCILPPTYFSAIETALQQQPADAFGGPDKAHCSFTTTQKAINYAMTSFFTTGGIRGGKKKMDRFFPRSFNMGIKRSIYNALGGFSTMRFGEDVDFSLRILEANYSTQLFQSAWVYHKRRTNFLQFFKQVYNSGIARIHLYKRHPQSLKLVHLLPSIFTLGVLLLLCLSFYSLYMLLPLLLFIFIIATDAIFKNKSLSVGVLSIIASFVQLLGYGSGFIYAWWERIILKRNEFNTFTKNFYS